MKEQFQAKTASLKSIRGRLRLFKIFTVVAVLMAGLYLYLNKFQVNVEYLIWAAVGSVVGWVLVIFRTQYLELMVKRTQAKL